MPFEWACFISYRHGQGELIREFIEELHKALENRLGIRGLGLKVYLDKKRLEPSYSVDPGLAEAICKSVCMIVVYNAGYFDKENPFCAKEFLAMKQLEKKRLVDKNLPKKYNLIIPIIIRKHEHIPLEIMERNPCDFTKLYIDPEEQLRVLKLQNKMKKQTTLEIEYTTDFERIADVIHELYGLLTEDDDVCCGCEKFEFPAEKEVGNFLKKTSYHPLFPGRKPKNEQ